jgi:hypothetical protein
VPQLFKVGLNHLQHIALQLPYDIPWPNFVLALLSTSDATSTVSPAAIPSLSCLFPTFHSRALLALLVAPLVLLVLAVASKVGTAPFRFAQLLA